MARSLTVYAPDRTTPVLNLPNSSATAEEVRAIVSQMGFTAVENAEYTETIKSDNGREIRFKRVTGGNKGGI